MGSFTGKPVSVVGWKEQQKRRLVRFLIVVISLAIVLVAVLAVYHWYINRYFSGYEITKSITVKNGISLEYVACDDGIIRYGRDGVTAINRRGEDIWAGSYEMTNPKLDVCGSSVVVADVGGTSLYVYRGKDTGVDFSVDYPIVEACVSKQGVIAVLTEESSSNTISIYDPFAKTTKLLVEIPTNVEEGYPVALDISPDGTSVAAAYLCVTTGTTQSRVTFYHFADVAKNVNYLVGAQNYDETLIADVEFLDENHVCLFGEKGFYVWENMKQPKNIFQKEETRVIQSAFLDSTHVGLILDKGDGKNELSVYDLSGNKILQLMVEAGYTSVQIVGDEILLSSTDKCAIYRLNGVKKYDSDLKDRISYFFKGDSRNTYLFIQNSKIKIIKLK